ncbi:hypothetical protein [Thiothrix nivea]|uniref:hypothetical protein n=1 Tax=Thiothrix nivea TaxID=1031 RepID=UPI0002DAF64D|nr:hypothetical protein [Thiothrix nivea]
MNIQELNNLVDDPGSVSWSIKSLALIAIMAALLFLGYQLVVVKQLEGLDGLERKEQELRKDFDRTYALTAA